MDKRTEKMTELMKNKEFVNKLLTIENPVDVQAYFEENGLELSMDEVKQLGTMLSKVASGEISHEQIEKAANGELSEEELESAAGGMVGIFIAGGILAAAGIADAIWYAVDPEGADKATGAAVSAVGDAMDAVVDFFRSW